MNKCELLNLTIQRLCNANSGGGGGGLPAEYQQVEYLESSGAQIINTDIDVNDNNVIDCTFTNYSISTTFVCGSVYAGWATNTLGYNSGAGMICYYLSNKGYKFSQTGTLHVIASKDSVTVDGVSIASSSDNNGGGGKFCMFSCYQRVNSPGRQYGKIKLYSLTISKYGTPLGDYIPCYRKSDGKPGLYDLVTNTFLTNAGTDADFTVGNNV